MLNQIKFDTESNCKPSRHNEMRANHRLSGKGKRKKDLKNRGPKFKGKQTRSQDNRYVHWLTVYRRVYNLRSINVYFLFLGRERMHSSLIIPLVESEKHCQCRIETISSCEISDKSLLNTASIYHSMGSKK